MNGRIIKFYLREGTIIFVQNLRYDDLQNVVEAFNNEKAIHVAHVHIAPKEVLYYETY